MIWKREKSLDFYDSRLQPWMFRLLDGNETRIYFIVCHDFLSVQRVDLYFFVTGVGRMLMKL
jgi:hypothetical protein